MKLSLPDVTLCMTDTRCHELAKLAVIDCMAQADFREVLIFSDRDLNIPNTTWHPVDDWEDKDAAQIFLWSEVPAYIRTSHFIFCEWDAWIINGSKWRDSFLNYDYVGAPWAWMKEEELNVGNGGFSLRSTRLAKHVAAHPDRYPIRRPFSNDILLCQDYRPALEAEGFAWPPEKLACHFAFETRHDFLDTFAFHGMFNWPLVISGRRLRERMQIARETEHIRKTQPENLVRLPYEFIEHVEIVSPWA